MEQIQRILIIGLGGFVGANMRYWVSGWAADRFGATFPWGTLIINISGSCLLGVFLGWVSNHISIDPRVRLLVATGFFGAYTTFSTYANESVALFQSGNWIGALGNVLVTNLICLGGALLGIVLATRFL
jgi:CrcB protein